MVSDWTALQTNAIRYMTTVPLALRENVKRVWRTTDGAENNSSLNIKESRASRGSFCFRKSPDKRGLWLQLFPKTLVTDLSVTAANLRPAVAFQWRKCYAIPYSLSYTLEKGLELLHHKGTTFANPPLFLDLTSKPSPFLGGSRFSLSALSFLLWP